MVVGILEPLARQDDLRVLYAGMEQCQPAHAFRASVRDYYLIHYILSGKGIFQSENQIRPLQAGQGFLICPDQVTFYQADEQDPWRYVWIAFSGQAVGALLRQAGLSRQSPVITGQASNAAPPSDLTACFLQITEALDRQNCLEMRLTGMLHLLMACLIEQNPDPPGAEDQVNRKYLYDRKARDFLEVNYARKIAIAGLARQLGLDRSYFGLIFRQVTGDTPQRYLLKLRIAKACSLMTHTHLPIAAVARSVGYDDQLLFSRMFRRVMACSPSEYGRRQAACQD